MRACAWAAVLVLGCAEAHWPQPSEVEQRAIDAAREAWLDDGRSDCETPNGLIHARSPEHYAHICVGSSVQSSAACFNPTLRLIVFRPGLTQDWKGEPTIHEMMHALGRCGGDADSQHEDPQIWRAAGGEDSVQWAAERAFIAGELDAGR